LEYETVPLDLKGYNLLMLNTNVEHTLANSEYNTRRAACQEGVAIFQKTNPAIKALRDVSYAQFLEMEGQLPKRVRKRCRHIILENERVLKAVQALRRGDLKEVGALIYQTHFSLQKDYEVSCPELDFLVNLSYSKDYILGSRLMGGGFGGCTINIIEEDKTDSYIDLAAREYKKQFGIDLSPILVSIEDGSKVI